MAAVKRCTESVWQGMTRRKTLEDDVMATPLKRCLKWWHLTFFGVGQMAGAGVYVLTGTVAKTQAGPATFVSYLIAGLCAIFAALCYAEFGARCPKAGSAYTYAYLTVGEFIGFSIGWNLLLEHCIGGASTARAWGSALDSLTNNAIHNWTVANVGSVTLFGHEYYPDLVSVIIVAVLTCFVLYGAELSMTVTGIISIVNGVTTVLIVVLGLSIGDLDNWTQSGFAPHGVGGVISGASMVFYAYVGFDAIAMAGEEAENPSKALPIANMLSIGIVMTMYVTMSIALTLAVPSDLIDPNAAFSAAFSTRGMDWARILVNVVMLLVIQGSTISALYAGPRCAYSMASDGIIFRGFAYVHPWTQTPVVAILFFSTISALTAVLLDVETLAEFVSLGTLMASLVVSACIVVLRYQPDLNQQNENSSLTQHDQVGALKPSFQKIAWLSGFQPGQVPKYATMLLCLSTITGAWFALVPVRMSWWSITGQVVSCLLILFFYGLITMHVQTRKTLTFQIPCVPLLPTVSMLVISCLLVRLSTMAWLRFIVWMAIGLAIYFGYGIRQSNERTKQKNTYVTLSDQSPPSSDNGDSPITDTKID